MTQSRLSVIKVIVLIVVLIAASVYLYAKINHVKPLSMVDKSAFNTYSGVAIKGFDPVSYFVEGPKEGSAEYQIEWQGAKWQFASQENLELFLSNPDKYSPSFGGYCSFAVTTGFTATIDPQAYLIKDDRLYLFNGHDLKVSFMINTDKSIGTAQKNWKE